MLFIYYDDDILISYYRSFQIPWFFHHQPRQMGQVSKTVRRSSSKMWILRKKLAAMAGTLAQKSCFFSDMIYCEETSYIYIYVIYRYNYISIYLFIVSDWKKKHPRCFLEDQCLIPVSVEGLELDSNYSVAARPLCLSDRLKVQDYETPLVYLWVAISKVCSENGQNKGSTIQCLLSFAYTWTSEN